MGKACATEMIYIYLTFTRCLKIMKRGHLRLNLIYPKCTVIQIETGRKGTIVLRINIEIVESIKGRTQLQMKLEGNADTATPKERKAAMEVNAVIREALSQFTSTKKDPMIAMTKEDVETLRGLENLEL